METTNSNKTLVLNAFKAALEANGEKLGSIFERCLLKNFIKEFPEYKEDLLQASLEWITFDGNIYDVGEGRLRHVYEKETGIKTTPSWRKGEGNET